jgi:hypothetical protein
MNYSRQNPSQRYQQLLAMYRQMHLLGDTRASARETFDGRSLAPQAPRIKRLIERSSARRILDYGSGKGVQYDPAPFAVKDEGQWDGVLDYWEVDEVVCFDPAYPPYSRLPEGRFDGVIATDVLEHCPEEDVDWIVAEMFAYATRFVYATIACYPATKRLPNGENAHCTIRAPEWWEARFRQQASAHPELEWEAWLQKGSPTRSVQIEELRLGSC